MKTNTVLKGAPKAADMVVNIDAKVAKQIAQSWQNITATEMALSALDTGVFQWRAAPAAQVAMAAMVADELAADDKILTLGFQAYPWVAAVGTPVSETLCIQLGKSLPQNVMAVTVGDMIDAMQGGKMRIVAIHAESSQAWDDVRKISSAAVKSETPMLMVVSVAGEAPKGIAVEVIESWSVAVRELREAIVSVRDQKAIRIVAMADMSAAEIETAMIEAAKIPAGEWQNVMQKNADGAEIAVNAAYQAPVKSF